MRSTKTIERGAFICALVILILGTHRVALMAREAREAVNDDDYWEFAWVFNDIFHHIQNEYVDEVDPELLFRGAINGMFLALDDHSTYMAPDSFDQLEKETEGEFSGVGLHITLRDGVLTVIAPIPGGPAASLGIQPWDRIIKIDEVSTEGITLTDAVRKLTGPRGSQVKVEIWRPGMGGKGEELSITRDIVKIHSVFTDIIDGNIGYIRVARFSDKLSRDVARNLNRMRDAGVEGLILDFRFNPGGLLSEAVELSDLFLPKGDIIVSTRGRDKEKILDEYRAERPEMIDWPIMILVNGGSASASEIVTAALRDHNRALVIGPKGETTFGKGSVQTISALEHTFEKDKEGNKRYGALKLTTALYYTPSGKQINKIGITPDVGVVIPEGHNRELLMHGLLGEPDLREPTETNGEATPSPAPEATPAATPAPAAPDNVIEFSPDSDDEAAPEAGEVEPAPFFVKDGATSATTEEKPAEFHDIMLEEATRLMKAYLILGGKDMIAS